MDLEPLDERIVIRVPSDLRNKLQKIAEDEDTSVTGAARALIQEGIDSRQRIEEMERQYAQLLEAFISMPQRNRMAEALDNIEARIAALEAEKETVEE